MEIVNSKFPKKFILYLLFRFHFVMELHGGAVVSTARPRFPSQLGLSVQFACSLWGREFPPGAGLFPEVQKHAC